jgi:hypothetical protein
MILQVHPNQNAYQSSRLLGKNSFRGKGLRSSRKTQRNIENHNQNRTVQAKRTITS